MYNKKGVTMKRKLLKALKVLSISILVLILIGLFFPTWTPKIIEENSISVLEQVKINGTDHEIMIRGKNKSNPVIIFVHGGPGCSEIPYVIKYQDLLEDNFTIVHYDQRASGKSYHFFEDYSNLSTDLLVEDLLEMTDYISDRLDKEKVILIGHSFGTYIGTKAVYEAPEKYEAYVGIGQMSDVIESEIESLNYCIDQAHQMGNYKDVEYLQELREDIDRGEMLTPRNYVRKYGGTSRQFNDETEILKGYLFGSEYNLLDSIRFLISVNKYQGDLLEEAINDSLVNHVTKLEVPCYFIMGKYDYMTTVKAAKNYFNEIEAEEKEFVIFEESAHYPQFEEEEKFYEWMCEKFIK